MTIVVTGLPRSGTTLMMRMLYRGGHQVYAEDKQAFENNLSTELPDNNKWLEDCKNKAVKVLDPLKHRLPIGPEYKFIMMWRDPAEILKSQVKFLTRGYPGWRAKKTVREVKKDLYDTREYLKRFLYSDLIVVKFEDILAYPAREAFRVAQFVNPMLDIDEMADCVMARGPECLSVMAEDDIEEEE